jgi:uncharacterized Zn finger protein
MTWDRYRRGYTRQVAPVSPATTWWGRRWLAALEQIDDWGRLQRGRSYARSGHVFRMVHAPAGIVAHVLGSYGSHYEVRMRLLPFPEPAWERVLDVLAAEARYGAALLAGIMPEGLDEMFESAGASMFPVDMDELDASCTCADWSRPCKHVAAVCYLFAERIDADPFVLLDLRGRSRADILAALRERRRVYLPAPSEEEHTQDESADIDTEAEDAADAFWLAGAPLEPITPTAGVANHAAPVKQLGAPPFWHERKEFLASMEKSYEVIAAQALRSLRAATPKPRPEP